MGKNQQIMSLFGDIVDLYRDSEGILIEMNSDNATADYEELEAKCEELMFQAQKLVA